MQEFKVNRQFTFSFILIGLTLFIASWVFNVKFETAKLDIFHFIFYGFSALFLAIGAYSFYFIRLFVSEIGVRLEDSYLGWLSFEFSWQEVDPVMTFSNPLNKRTHFFFYSHQRKLLKSLNPMLFETVDGKQYSQAFGLKEKIFGSKEATVLEQAIRQHANEIRDVTQTEIRTLVKGSSADLGKEAALLAGASTIMFAIGVVLLILGNSKHLLMPTAHYTIGAVSVLAAIVAIKLLPSEKKLANYLIVPLFSACCTWLFVQCMHFYILQTTEAQAKNYRLSESLNVYQIWQSESLPDIAVNADPGNLAYEEIGSSRLISIHVGPLGFYDISREEVNKLLKKNQTMMSK